eukprot:TRINITY_DN4242_c0_g2_i7.p1 TRINITY_DN4242_c0_g2~~TRINITY_DN4242_c0_g2_i7.p1  ORF type:complete len:471 (+),score=100.22 TRINITY_DN4242_c0_g2_i7:742-2154(+)
MQGPLTKISSSRFYALDTDQLKSSFPHSLLAAYVSFQEKQNVLSSRLVYYECRNATYEEFYVLYRILSRMFVGEEEIKNYRNLIDYHGIGTRDILVTLSAEPDMKKEFLFNVGYQKTTSGDCGSACDGGNVNAQEQQFESKLVGKFQGSGNRTIKALLEGDMDVITYMVQSFGPLFEDGDVIVCATDQRTKVVSEVARVLNLPYVPFCVLFCEGTFDYGGELIGTPPAVMPMLPCFITVGDYNNLFFVRHLMKTCSGYSPVKMSDYSYLQVLVRKEEYNSNMKPGDIVDFQVKSKKANTDSVLYSFDGKCNEAHHSVFYGLEIAVPNVECLALESILAGHHHAVLISGVFLPSGDDYGSPGTIKKSGDKRDLHDMNTYHLPNFMYKENFPLFHVDSKGMTCFSRLEAARASKYIEDIDLVRLVAAQIANTKFEMVQENVNKSHYFCNETVAGNLNYLRISGCVKLPPSGL